MDWSKLAAASHYQTAVAVRQELAEANIEEATRGLEELIDALGRSDKRALRSQLTRLMTHIIKWRSQPSRRSRSWVASITDARIEIASLLEDEPSLRREVPDIWDRCLQAAQRLARDETGLEPGGPGLTMGDVFDVTYTLDD